MPWLERSDRRISRAPSPVIWLYTAIKATLIVIGAIALVRMLLDRSGIWPYFP